MRGKFSRTWDVVLGRTSLLRYPPSVQYLYNRLSRPLARIYGALLDDVGFWPRINWPGQLSNFGSIMNDINKCLLIKKVAVVCKVLLPALRLQRDRLHQLQLVIQRIVVRTASLVSGCIEIIRLAFCSAVKISRLESALFSGLSRFYSGWSSRKGSNLDQFSETSISSLTAFWWSWDGRFFRFTSIGRKACRGIASSHPAWNKAWIGSSPWDTQLESLSS